MAEKKTPNEIFRELRGNSGGNESVKQTPNEVFAQIMFRANSASHVKEANRFIVDVDKFYRAVDMDTSGESQFNAADYFEERKKQAQELKDRAAAMSLYMDDHADSFSKESYERMMNILSTFDTDVDDVMSRYQPSIDAKTGMRAYEDELIDAMERNEQLRKLDKMADYAFDPGSPSANFMQLFRQYQNDESYRAITDNWTEEDRYTLGLLQQEDPAKAREFAIERNNYYNAQATDPMRQQIREQAPGNILGNTGKALLAGMAGAGEIFDRLAETAARGQTTEKGYITPSDYAQETTGAISEYLNQKYGTVNTENFQNLRDIGQQGLRDANVDPTYIGGAGNGLLDLARDVVDNKGVGDLYNFGYSLAQNLTSRYTLGNIGGQPLVLANYFANAATSAIDDARRRGASGSQAMGIGLIKGALEVGTEFIPTSELFKMGPAVTVKDFLKSVGVEALEEFVGEGANALGGYIADKAIMGDLSEFETAKRKYMEEQGMTEEQAHAQAIKDAITNIVSEGISGALSGAISGGAESAFKTGLANQYYRNINPQTLIDEGMNTEQGSDAYRLAQQMQERVDNDQRVSGNQKRVLDYELRKLAAAKVAAETAAENQPAAQEQETKKPAEKPAVSKEGRSIQISTEAPIDINDFAEIKNGKATIQLKDGGTVDYSDVSFATEAEANQYYAVSTLPGIETEAANDLLHTIQESGAGQDDQGIIAVREAYRLGYAGAQASELANSDASVLTPDLQQKVFEIGQSQRRADSMANPTVREAATKPTEGYKKVVIEGKISKPNKKTQKKWDAEIAFMDYIADNFSGNAVHVYESYKGMDGRYYYRDSNGKVNRAPNGRYVNGEIWVDLRSGDNQEGLVLNTFAHEMYHHIERFDKAKAQELAEFVVKELGMESVDKAVEAQIQKARKAGFSEAYFMNVKGMTAEQARNEVYMRAMSDFVADSLEAMFTRGDPAKAIADLKKENRTLFDQIKAFIDKWVSKLKDFYKDKTVSEEGAVVAQLKNFEQLQKLFMEGVQSAGENYRAAEVVDEKSTTQDGDAMYSERNDAKITLEMTDSERAEILKNKVITAPVYAGQAQRVITESKNDLGSQKESLIKSALVKIGEEFGVFTDYSISDVDIDIRLSKGNLKESVSKKINPMQIAKLMPVLKTAVENAVGVECHANRYFFDNDTVMFENLIGGYVDGNGFIPVRFGLKHSVSGKATLYLIVDQEKIDVKKIKAEVAKATAVQNDRPKTSRSAFNISLARIVPFVNGKDLLRYLPDNMLNNQQREAKYEAMAETVVYTNNKNDHKYADYIRAGKLSSAKQMVQQAAKTAGYTKMFFHGAKKGGGFTRFREWSYFTENKQYAERYAQRDNPGSLYELYGKMDKPFDTRDNKTREIFEDIRNEYGLSDIQESGLPDWTDGYDITDYISANDLDYDTVILDEGGDMVDGKPVSRGLSYVIRKSNQVKSADVITYDDDGNIIPISQRFNEENEDIRYSLRNEKPATDRDILMNLDANAQKVSVKGHLQRYQDRLTKLAELEPVHEDLKAQIEGLSQAEKPNYKEINRLKSEERRIRVDVNQMNGMVRSFERSDMGKRLVAEERLKIQKAEFKSFREEQKALARANTAEQRLIREELTGVTSIMTVMEDEFIKLAKDYEEQKIDLKTMEEEFMRLANEYDKQTKDVNIWEREFKRLLKEYDTIKGQRERAKAKVETLQKQGQRKKVESQVKSLMKMLKNPTKDAHIPMVLQEPLRKFLDSIDFTSRRQASGGSPTIKDIAYAKALRAIRDAVASQRTAMDVTNGTFALDVPAEFLDRIENHIKVIEGSTEGLNLTTNRVYEMRSEELKDLNHILTVINKAIRQIDKFHLQGERARISGYAKETVQEMESRKPVKGENGNKYLWGNSTPWYAFRRYGKAGQKIFKGLMQGQAKLAKNIDSIVKFAEETYTNKEVREWERKRHTIKLDSGKAVTMSTAQIMSFWCLSNRDQAIPHMQGGGMRPTTLKKSVDGTNVQNEMVQKEHFTLTRADVNRINNLLTGRQREVAGKLQQFMQTVGGRFVNEVSMARWDYMAATETDYFPIQTDDTGRDVKNPEQERTSLFALLNKSFTKAPVKNSRNALVVDSIFNVFANHMSETAEYNAFALPLVDAMKWFNYNERIDVGDGHIKDVSVHNAIKNTLGKNAKQYFIDLMTDINSSQKAGRYEDFFGKILGRSKVSSVAWNTRVAIQQLSALPRASMVLKPRYLLAGVSKFRLQYAVKEMQKYSGIALWKSMGYYDLNVARSVERQIKHDTSFLDQFNETGMWLPGKMDERTWAKIWIATREQIKNERNLSGEELLRATADMFEEVVYQTQVADSVLTRSSFMRSKSQLIKEATSFMAEPTLATNILMYAFEDYEAGHTTLEKAKRGLMIGFTGYALSAVANALLGSLSDAWRDDDEYETYWEKYGQALFGSKEKFFMDGNLFSELNPLEKFIFVKDLLAVAKGFEPNSSYSKLISGMLDLVKAYQSAAEGKTSKTAYGVVYQTLQYLSTVGGVGISNITRELVDVWNNTFGKWNPDQKLVRYQSDNGEELLNALQKGTPEDIQRVFGRFENQQKAESALQSAIGEQYRDGKLTAEEAEKLLTENFDRDDEHEVYWILDKWDYAKKNGSSEGYLKYSKFLEGVETGTFETEMDRLLQNGSDASDIRSEITKKYRKQYLEDETAREGIRQKLRPVFEATGMYDDEIAEKFNDWDFEAEYGMTYSAFKSEYKAGNVTEAEMRDAMDFYGKLNYEIDEEIRDLKDDVSFEKKFGMTLGEMKDAYDHGDVTRNKMIEALVFTGKSRKDAQAEVSQRDISNNLGIEYANLGDAYMAGDISRSDLRNSILKNGETVKNTDEAMMGYDWLKKNIKKYPDLAIDDAKKFAVRIHPDYAPDETLEDYGVSIDAYIDYQRLRPECKGVDANGDGKTDDGTLRDSIFQMIDSLPISSEAKDGLALMSYSAKSIRRNAPWH